ncbi:MAG: MoaD/ThiS family protein [Candidatus Hadarchaeales archaeon]
MEVRVRIAASRESKKVEIPAGARVRDLIEKLKYNLASIALIHVNGNPATAETALRDGDEIVLVPTVDGGAPETLGGRPATGPFRT